MIGNNTLMLNESSMIQAVQQWLDGKTVEVVGKVKSVSWNGTIGVFNVHIESPVEVETK
jgi:hypothetical protein